MPREGLVYAVDDDKDFLASLRSMLEAAGFQVSTFTAARELINALSLEPASCVISDLRMPGIDGMELQRQLTSRGIRIPIIFVTGYGDMALAVNAMKSGAVDFIEKPVDGTTLIDSISRAIAASHGLQERSHAEQHARTVIATLSMREREVFDFLAQGLQNVDISQRLGISPRTVEVHRANVYRKLEVKNLAALVRLALLAGVASPTDLREPRAS